MLVTIAALFLTSGPYSGASVDWGSLESRPLSVSYASRKSLTWRAMGPSVSKSWVARRESSGGIDEACGILPTDGFRDATPQQNAGFLTEPPISLPSPRGLMPEANAEASPPLEPPGVRSAFQGLSVLPCRGLSVVILIPSSGKLVRPSGIAPAAFMRATTGASKEGIESARAGTPLVVAESRQSMFSLMVNGTPCRGPVGSRRSASAAATIAESARTTVIAFNLPFTASILPRWLSITSWQDVCLVLIKSASVVADRRQRSSAMSISY